MNTQELLKQAEQSVEGIEQLAETLQPADDEALLCVSSSIRAGDSINPYFSTPDWVMGSSSGYPPVFDD